jgi:hypothetical protein
MTFSDTLLLRSRSVFRTQTTGEADLLLLDTEEFMDNFVDTQGWAFR